MSHSPTAKPAAVLSIEGRCAKDGGRFPRRRIEIDRQEGLILQIGEPTGSADIVLGEKEFILPGLLDFHVHAREDTTGRDNYKEDFVSAGEAAIHGGVTGIADMPNNPQPPVDDESYRKKREIARRSPVDVLLYAGIGPRTRPLSFAVPYKAYMGPSIGEMFFETEASLREALARYRGQWVAFHAEKPEILTANRGRPTHAERRPPEAEIQAVELALDLAREFGLEPHICHLSTAGGLEKIRAARRRGQKVTCEVTPHHLYFDLEGLAGHPRFGYFQANPPIRPREDRLALLDGLRNGEIELLATDHAPHSLAEKDKGTSGLPHLDTFGPFLFWLANDQGFSWDAIRRAAAENPGRLFTLFLGERFGVLEEGAVGSLTVLDPSRSETIDRASLRTRSGWSPFERVTFPGRVSRVVVRGRG